MVSNPERPCVLKPVLTRLPRLGVMLYVRGGRADVGCHAPFRSASGQRVTTHVVEVMRARMNDPAYNTGCHQSPIVRSGGRNYKSVDVLRVLVVVTDRV